MIKYNNMDKNNGCLDLLKYILFKNISRQLTKISKLNLLF